MFRSFEIDLKNISTVKEKPLENFQRKYSG